MVDYPLTPTEKKVVAWTGRLMTLLAIVTITLFGAAAFTSS